MGPEGSPLDLNNLPEDNSRDGKQASDQDTTSYSGVHRKKKSGAKEGKDDHEPPNKVYECRFCSLKFCKSQALGGHMNRHRQERETETLNKARQLVFTNDLVNPAHLGYISSGGYNAQSGDGSLPFRSMYTPRLFPVTSAPLIPPPRPVSGPYVYTSPPPPAAASDYFLGHVIPNSGHGSIIPPESNSYTCIGEPVGPELPSGGGGCAHGPRGSQEEVQLNWGKR